MDHDLLRGNTVADTAVRGRNSHSSTPSGNIGRLDYEYANPNLNAASRSVMPQQNHQVESSCNGVGTGQRGTGGSGCVSSQSALKNLHENGNGVKVHGNNEFPNYQQQQTDTTGTDGPISMPSPVSTQLPLQISSSTGTEEEQQQKQEKDDYHYDDDEIQRDAADETVAFIIHIALLFFLILLFGTLVACILIVGKYGFLTLILIGSILLATFAIGFFMSSLMDEDKVLKPARKKLRRMHALATAVVVKEMRDFHMDMNEHFLMLTNGDDHDSGANGAYGMTDDQGRPIPMKKKRRGPRSKVFGFLVKPFLKKKDGKRFHFSRKKKEKKGNFEFQSPQNAGNADHEIV